MSNVFVVILNWNQPELTIDCVKSIEKCQIANVKLQIVVVDNGSGDDSVEVFKKLKIENCELKIIRNDANLGFAGGNNVGINYALDKGSDYIMVLNNDTIIDEDLTPNLVAEMEKDSHIGAVSPKIYFAKGYEFHKNRYEKKDLGKVIWYAGGVIDWNNIYGVNRGVDEVDKGQYDKETEIDFATGACFLARAETLRDVGLFDEKYFMYLEDIDLSVRMKKKGWRIIFQPKAKLWHKVAQSSGIGSDLNDYFISRNRLLFGMRYASLRTKIALLKESVKLLLTGRKWQKIGICDFYLGRSGKGSWN